jgi:hypothetical protein
VSATGLGKGFGQANPGGTGIAVTDGLILWYRMENNNNNTSNLVDATSNLGVGANQTSFSGINQGSTFQSSGGTNDIVRNLNPSGAYSYDGVDDFTEITTTNGFEGTKSYTVSFFLSLESKPSSNSVVRIFGNGFNGNTHPFHIEYEAGFRTNSENIAVRRFDGSNTGFLPGGSLPLSTFKLITVTHDSNDTFEIFVDDVSQNRGGVAANPVSNNAREIIAATDNNGTISDHTNCVVDDPRVYDRVLTDSEIVRRHNNTKR